MTLPDFTPEQRAENLRKAAATRKARAEAIARLRSGSVGLAEVLADEESPLQRAFARQLLLALPGVGPASADRAMTEIGIAPKRRASGLSPRQREALAERFATAGA